jgi:hypothetical protein
LTFWEGCLPYPKWVELAGWFGEFGGLKGVCVPEQEEDLVLDKLVSGDRPSLYATGMVGAQSLKEAGIAVFMLDVLGRVHLVPPQFVEVKRRPRLRDEELHALDENDAMELLLKQEDSEDSILAYMARRAAAHSEKGGL